MIIEIKVPSPGESITEVEIESWMVSSGDFVEEDAIMGEINSDKATLEIIAAKSGVVELLAAEGDTVAVGDVIAKIDTEGKGAGSANGKEEKKVEKAAEKQPEKKVEASKEKSYAAGTPSPSAEKMMKDKGIESESVEGSGRGGRITKADVVKTSDRPKVEPKTETKAPTEKPASRPIPALPTAGGGGERVESREKMSSLRRKIAERLVSVKNETAMLTTFNEVDLFEIMEMRKKWKEKFKETHGVGLGYMSFFTKAVTMALAEFPKVGGQIEGKEMVTFNYADIGIAVGTPRGLVVPIIRDAQAMTLAQLELSVLHYALKARENKITIDDMTGGTFTITNGGIFGSMLSTPILNPPQSAILGMHNIVQRPMAVNGQVEIRPIMYVALSYDHRIIDGAEAVSFLFKVKERLESPERLMLEV